MLPTNLFGNVVKDEELASWTALRLGQPGKETTVGSKLSGKDFYNGDRQNNNEKVVFSLISKYQPLSSKVW